MKAAAAAPGDQTAAVIAHLGLRWSCTFTAMGLTWGVGYALCRHGQRSEAMADVWVRPAIAAQLSRIGGVLVPLEAWKGAKALCTIADLPYVVVVMAEDGRLLYSRQTSFAADIRMDEAWARDEYRVDVCGHFIPESTFVVDTAWSGGRPAMPRAA